MNIIIYDADGEYDEQFDCRQQVSFEIAKKCITWTFLFSAFDVIISFYSIQ